MNLKGLLLISAVFAAITGFSQVGSDCENAHLINQLPFSEIGLNTADAGNNISNGLDCGSTYLSGNDYLFKYIPESDMEIEILLSNTGLGVGVHAFKNCPTEPTAECLNVVSDNNGNPEMKNFAVMKDTVYYFVVSTYDFMGQNPATPFDIYVGQSVNTDVYVKHWNKPLTSCNLTDQSFVNMQVFNNGSDTLYQIPLGYTINNGTPVLDTVYGIYPPNEETNFNFAEKADLSTEGETYTIKIFTNMLEDENHSNDTMTRYVTHSLSINSYPYIEDFESGNGTWTTDKPENTWQAGEPTAEIINYAYSGTSCMATNLSGHHAPNEWSFLYSPCFDFSTNNLPVMEFKYWCQLTNIALVNIQYSLDYGETWTIMGTPDEGTNWYNTPENSTQHGWKDETNGWTTARYPLNSFAGEPSIMFAFVLKSNMSETDEGFAFDDFTIFEAPQNDLGMISLEGFSNSCESTGNVNPIFTIKNHGQNYQTEFQLMLSTDNGNSFINETFEDTIYSLEEVQYTFDQAVELNTQGEYNIIAKVSLGNDSFHLNDSITQSIFVFNNIADFPYSQDFESNTGGYDASGTNISWEYGTPTDSVITNAASGTKAWVTNLSGTHNQEEESYLTSPCFDFSTLSHPFINMDIQYQTIGFGTQFEVSTDNGQTWEVLGSSSDEAWYNQGYNWINNSGDWQNVYRSLEEFAGNTYFQFRFYFRGTLPKAGFAVDNIKICDKPEASFSYENEGQTVQFTNNSIGGTSYLWDFGDGNTSTDENPMHEYTSDDTVTVILTTYNNCSWDKDTIDIVNLDVYNLQKSKITVSPNPAKHFVKINSPQPINEISLYSVTGQKLQQKEIDDNKKEVLFILSKQSPGIYFLKIKIENHSHFTKLLISE